MKFIMLILCMAFLGIVSAQTFRPDPTASRLKWTGYAEIGGYSQSGTLLVKDGALLVVNGEVKDFEIQIDMSTITHDDSDLENHLKQKDFFYVKKYPIAQLKSIGKKGDYFICEMKIRGKTQKIDLPIKISKENSGYRSTGKIVIDRTKFDIKYNSSSYFQDLGSYAIKNEFVLEYDLYFNMK